MAKIYWTREVKSIMKNRLDALVDDLLGDKEATNEQIVGIVRHIRTIRAFADEVIAEMEAMDRAEDEDRLADSVKEDG
jgi:hypothetical protein